MCGNSNDVPAEAQLFSGKQIISIDRKDYAKGGTTFQRTAVRGFIKKNEKYALIQSKKYGEYKFPGGGRRAGEKLSDTLIREVKEETGLTVIPSTISPIGYAKELRKGEKSDIMEMVSYYYLCETEDTIGAQQLDDYEAEYGYALAYVTLEEAIANNKKLKNLEHIPWVDRDTAVMQFLLEQ